MKCSVIGIGQVGSTVSFVLAKDGLASEVVLVNRTRERARADAIDIQQAVAFVPHRVLVRDGSLEDTAGSDIVILCLSIKVDASLSNRDLLAEGNTRLIAEFVPELARLSPDAIFINVVNPLDTITHHILTLSGIPWQRVIGTGTLIDSARFRELLSEQVGVHPIDLNAYVLGEHGDSQFAALSIARCGGEHVDATPARRRMLDQAKQSAWDVFHIKGHTNYAVAMAVSHIVEAIVKDLRYTMPVSVLIDGYCSVRGVCLSVPCVIGRQGIHRRLKPDLDEDECRRFQNCAKLVGSVIERTKPLLGRT